MIEVVFPFPIQRQHDPLVFSLKHPGTGKLYFKADTEEQRDRCIL